MIYSRKLLEQFLPGLKNISDIELSNAVGSTGNELPVKDIFHHPKLNDLVIGRLISFQKHPNSDHLNVCKVQTDKNGTINTIVCGANNLVANKNVVVALNGAKLYDGRIIEYKELRGIKSEGMLCSYKELTPLNANVINKDDADGIMLFDDGIIGDTNVSEFLGLDDTIYEIEVPFANRNDINGVLSFCQDLSAFFDFKFVYPNPNISEKLINLKNEMSINKKACSSFALAKLENIRIQPSEWKIKSLLMNNGIKPLNNLLDTLNIITLLTNIPSAAYDASNISDIEVNFANKNENFSGFDGKEYKLDGKDIVVKTNNNIISIAGILGAKNFGTNKNSKDVYIEFANFNFVNLRNSANKYDIHTDAVRRNIHINTNYEILLAASLLQKYFAKNLIGYKLDVEIEKKKNIKINSKKINEIIGSNFKMNEIIEHLQKLGFGYNAQTKSVTPPLYRTDVTSIADISEEIIKSFDINKINEEPIKNSYSTINKHTEYYFIKKMWDILLSNYFNEAKTYNTINKSDLDKFNIFNYHDNVNIVSSNANRQNLRNNLVHSLLNIMSYNISYKNSIKPIFEIQKIYQKHRIGIKNITLLTPENIYLDKINNSRIVYNVNGLKGIINQIVSIFNAKVSYKVESNQYFYDNECISIIYENKIIGYIGLIKKSLLKNYNINEKIYAATINWDDLFTNFKNKTVQLSHISALMPIIKDIAFISKKDSYLQSTIEKIKSLEFIDNVEFIDKYEHNVDVSYTIRFYIKNSEGLTTNQIDTFLNTIINIFKMNSFDVKK